MASLFLNPTKLKIGGRLYSLSLRCGISGRRIWKATLLSSVPLGVLTSTVPVVAPTGTLVVISEAETIVNVAATPLKVTLLAPVRFVPRMVMAAPQSPEVGWAFTKGLSPTDNLNTVPGPTSPPALVVPYKFPSVACNSATEGPRAVRTGEDMQRGQYAAGVIRKIVPQLQLDPPCLVVPYKFPSVA